MRDFVNDSKDRHTRLLVKCCANVKWFYIQYMSFDLQWVLGSMSFANVEGFMVENMPVNGLKITVIFLCHHNFISVSKATRIGYSICRLFLLLGA